MMSLLYKEDWEETKERYRAWWAGEYFGRCALSVTAPRDGAPDEPPPPRPPTPEQRWGDLDYIAALNDHTHRSTFYGGEAFPTWEAGYPGSKSLPNRALLHDRIDTAVAVARRNKGRLALLYLDLDRFKDVNDTLGHAAGDQLLQAVAQRLRDCVRDADTVARLGGDEFVVLIAALTRQEDAETVAEKIRAALAEPVMLEGRALTVSTSIGIARWPENGDGAKDLLLIADAAMYAAKRRR